MIEKIMRAVKSSNKKRGRNITIGAIVGMLLSCTAVMGAEGDYLWIKNDSGTIEFSKDDGTKWEDGNPNHTENSWNGKTYTNNITLSGTGNGKNEYGDTIGYGLKLSGNLGKNFNFVNNGIISGTGTGYNDGYGVYLKNTTLGDIGNIGIIASSSYGSGYGVYLKNTTLGDIGNTGIISGNGNGDEYGIYLANTTLGDIGNNGIIADSSIGFGYGVYLSSDASSNTTMKTLTNTGIISGISSSSTGYGVELSSNTTSNTTMKILANTGIISGINSSSSSSGYGVNLSSNSTSNTTLKTLANTGIISGISSSSGSGYGVSLSSDLRLTSNTTVESMVNTGIISGISSSSGTGYGVELSSGSTSTSAVESMVNKGIIYGTTNAIYNKGGTISKAHNYGLLVNGDTLEKVVDGVIIISSKDTADKNKIKNFGLVFTATDSGYKNYDTVNDKGNFGETYDATIDGVAYKVRNVDAAVDNDGTITGIKSFVMKDGDLYEGADSSKEISENNSGTKIIDISVPTTNFILNGIENTLVVIDNNNSLSNGIITAYGNAVVFDTAGGKLTLSGTVVNGGLKNPNDTVEANRTYAIKGSSKADTLILENAVINGNINLGAGANIIEAGEGTNINGNISTGEGDDTFTLRNNVFINGNINTGGGADTLNIENGVQINGTLDGGTDSDKDTLNFGVTSNVKTTSSSEEIRILHNISNFENININSNVTFYEKTIDNDLKMVDLKITGVENLTIGENGVLTLRIDSTITDTIDGKDQITGHALYEAVPLISTSLSLGTGTSISSTGGKLLLALNGAGNESIISFGTTTLADTMVGAEDKSIEYQEDFTIDVTSFLHSVERVNGKNNEVRIVAQSNIPLYEEIPNYKQLNKIYKGVISVNKLGNFFVNTHENLSTFLGYLNDIYAGNPYSYSSELSRKSAGMFRDIVTENSFKPNLNNWLIYGGLTHIDGGTKDTYYGKGYYTYDIGSSDIESDTKITGAYMLGEYGVSDTLTSGVIIGGNKLKSDLSNGSKVDGDALYLGAYAKKYMGNLKVTAGLGFQYGDYDVDRMAVNRVASSVGESVTKYSSNYNDITYDIYLNGRYSNPIGDNLFLEPYATLSYTYLKQDGANEGSKALAIETDSKSFDYTVGKVGVDLKKIIPHSAGKSTLTAGVSYTKIFDGANEEIITGRFKGGSDFDILVAHKNQHSIGLNAKYALELESGILFDVKGTYSVERDSHNNSGKNRTKGEWIVGAGLGYKF